MIPNLCAYSSPRPRASFLRRYLNSEESRREINGGLNVAEQWNGANDLVFFARRSGWWNWRAFGFLTRSRLSKAITRTFRR